MNDKLAKVMQKIVNLRALAARAGRGAEAETAAAQAEALITKYQIDERRSDVGIVRYMFAWLTVEIERLAQREKGREDNNAFRCGASKGVLGAMRAARAEEVKAAPTGASAAIVLSSRHDESMAYLQKSLGGRFRDSVSRRPVTDAYTRGLSAGAGISNRNALTGGSTKLLGSGR